MNLLAIIRYVFITPWCPTEGLDWWSVIILSMHISGIANNAVSFSGVVVSLNNNESNNIHLFASTSTLHIALLELCNLFCVKYKYKSLKYELFRYHACISLFVTGRCVPFNTFLCIIFKFFLYQFVFVNISELHYWYWSSLPVLVSLAIEIYLVFDISLILYLLDAGIWVNGNLCFSHLWCNCVFRHYAGF